MTEIPAKNSWTRYLRTILIIIDLVIVNLTFVTGAIIFKLSLMSATTRVAWLLFNIAYLLTALAFNTDKHSDRAILMDRVLLRSVQSVILHALLFISMTGFIHIDYAMSFYVGLYAILIVALPVTWVSTRYWVKSLRRRGNNLTKVAIIGTSSTAMRLATQLNRDDGMGYNIVGNFDNDCLPDFAGNYIGTINDFENYVKNNKVDEVYFTLVGEKAEIMPHVVKIADDNMIQFYYVPKISRYVSGGFELHHIGSIPVLTLRRNPLTNIFKRGIKRAFDIVFSGVVLIFSPIVFIPVAIAIKASSPGPIFFKQERTGYRGRSFKCYKFRTMRVNAAADHAQATADDPRKTRVGDFLRRTSIDELPQFINVIRGDMSVVGPRPHMLKHTEDYTRLIDQYMVRHVVKPGITGWAQVNGYRGLTDELWKMEKRVEYDVWYIENWHFWLDIKIIIRTIMNAFRGEKNAF